MSLFSRFFQPRVTPIPAPLGEFHAEVLKAAQEIQQEGWRTSTALPIEIALGYAAFYYWFIGGEKLSGDQYHYQYPSDSSRKAARLIISVVSENIDLEAAVRKQRSSFNPQLELSLFDTRLPKTDPIWGESVSRFVIMHCRRLASAATGQIGHFEHFENLHTDDCRELGKQMLLRASSASIVNAIYPNQSN